MPTPAPTFAPLALGGVGLLVVARVLSVAEDAPVAQFQFARGAKRGTLLLLRVLLLVVVERLELLEVLLLRINGRDSPNGVVRHTRVALVEHVRSDRVGTLEAVIAPDANAAHGNLHSMTSREATFCPR